MPPSFFVSFSFWSVLTKKGISCFNPSLDLPHDSFSCQRARKYNTTPLSNFFKSHTKSYLMNQSQICPFCHPLSSLAHYVQSTYLFKKKLWKLPIKAYYFQLDPWLNQLVSALFQPIQRPLFPEPPVHSQIMSLVIVTSLPFLILVGRSVSF